MHDLKTTRPVAKATILKLEWVSMTPPSLDIYLRDEIKDVTGIYLDGISVDTWILLAPNKIRALPPVPDFHRISVYVEPYSLHSAGVQVALEPNQFIAGPDRLLQLICRLWMTAVGSIMDHSGVGILVTQTDMNEVGLEGLPYLVTERVKRMEDTILLVQQAQKPRLMDNETLSSLELLMVLTLPGTMSVGVYMRAITMAGSLLGHLSTEV